MRHLQDADDQQTAQALCDFLEVNQVESELREGKKWSVWVIEDDDHEKAQALAETFDPNADHSADATALRKKRELAARPLANPGRTVAINRDPAGPLTIAIIVATIAVALGTQLAGDLANSTFRMLLVVPPVQRMSGGVSEWVVLLSQDIEWTQPWRLITPMFLHFGIMHIVFNVMWIHTLGSQIENRGSWVALAVLVIVAQALGSVAQFYLKGPFFGGLSGVNYALFGYVWMNGRYGKQGYAIDSTTTVMMMGWLLLCATGMVGPIANAAHGVGLMVGLAAGLPLFITYARTHTLRRSFEKGSWEDLNLHGWARFRRLWVDPFVPLWFLAAAALVTLSEL